MRKKISIISSNFSLFRLPTWICFGVICCILYMPDPVFCQTETPIQKKDTLSSVPPELSRLFENIMKEKNTLKSNSDNLEINGLIFDETRTKAGRQFYEDYYNSWDPPPSGSFNYSIFISELPFMMNITFISVKLNDFEVLNARLQPREEYVSALVQDAISMTMDALQKIEELETQIENGDQTGSGIY